MGEGSPSAVAIREELVRLFCNEWALTHSGRLYRRINSELLTTLTELNAIAAPPIIG